MGPTRRANKDPPSETREDHNYLSCHPHAFRHTSSWSAPRAGPLKRTSLHMDKPKKDHRDSHKKGSGIEAQHPRVARRKRGVTLGILNLLGSGYEFQGWHFSKERERGWQSLTRVCRTYHKLLRSFGAMRHAQPASALADPGATHFDLGRRLDSMSLLDRSRLGRHRHLHN